jgi:hypothetical protein
MMKAIEAQGLEAQVRLGETSYKAGYSRGRIFHHFVRPSAGFGIWAMMFFNTLSFLGAPRAAADILDPPVSSVTADSAHQLTVSWEEITGYPDVYYIVYRGTEYYGTYSIAIGTTNTCYFEDSGLQADTTYYYAVGAGTSMEEIEIGRAHV